MIRKYFLFFFLILFNFLSSQTIKNEIDLCSLYEEGEILHIEDRSIENELKKILTSIGASEKEYLLQACSKVENASAVLYKGKRYILYGKDFLISIVNNSSLWSNTFILAHEVGHHINGHTLDLLLLKNNEIEPKTESIRHKQELQADRFAGFVLAKLGATINEASQSIALISNSNDSHSHPNKYKRLEAIKEGFNDAFGNSRTSVSVLNSAYEYFLRARNKYESKDYSGAIIDYDSAINMDNDFYEAYYNRGICKKKLGDYSGAIDDYNLFISFNQNDVDAYLDRALCKIEINDYDSAFADLSLAISIDDSNEKLYFTAGILLKGIGDKEEALNYFQKAILINSKYELAYYERAKIFFTLKLFNEVINECDSALEINSNSKEMYSLRGRSKYQMKDYIEAIKDFNAYIGFDNANPDVYNYVGLCKYELKDYVGSIKAYDVALSLNSNYINGYVNRGIAKEKIRDINGACQDWKKASFLGCGRCVEWLDKQCL
mgnify:CR=1 FL=1|tara:strand:- start:1484 stop:2962 length:1479 start_codon:yes stop_codon:yes gene_type:complete